MPSCLPLPFAPPGRRARRCRLAVAGALLAVAVALAGCGAEAEPPEAAVRPVRYERARLAGGVQERTLSGVAQAGTEVEASFRVSGVVDTVGVQVGRRVRRGEVLVRLDATDYVIQQRQAEAAVAQAQAQLRNAEATYERTQQLYASEGASQSDLDAARAQYASAQAQVRSAAAQLQGAQRQVGYTRLAAPVAGAVAEVGVEVGEQVAPGRTAVVLVGGPGRPEVQVAVPEGLIGRVQVGTDARVRFSALGGTAYDAVVAEAGVAATRGSTTFPATLRLTEDAAAVRPGMAAEVTLALRGPAPGTAPADTGRVVVPMQAVGEDRRGRFVFVLEPQGDGTEALARRRPVETGAFRGAAIEVVRGVAPGALVATAGVSALADSQRVTLLDDAP